MRGQIDRIDADEGVTLIRDWKTGRAQPRTGAKAEPMPVLDVQLAVYALVAERLAAEWGVPSRVAAAYAYINRGAEERSWRDDFRQTLAPAALEWLGVAGDLLAARAFPRTPDAEDCTYCRFRARLRRPARPRAPRPRGGRRRAAALRRAQARRGRGVMSSPARAPAPDQAERDAAVRERARNVLIDAGAGTGKTAILVDRLVEMVAPTAGTRPFPSRASPPSRSRARRPASCGSGFASGFSRSWRGGT